jgi:hypothetical protein
MGDKVLQKWRGYVTNIHNIGTDYSSFCVRLYDLTTLSCKVGEVEYCDEEYAEIYTNMLSEEDKELLEVGVSFDWEIIKDDTSKTGARSEFHFRPPVKWTQEMLDKAKKLADHYKKTCSFKGE